MLRVRSELDMHSHKLPLMSKADSWCSFQATATSSMSPLSGENAPLQTNFGRSSLCFQTAAPQRLKKLSKLTATASNQAHQEQSCCLSSAASSPRASTSLTISAAVLSLL